LPLQAQTRASGMIYNCSIMSIAKPLVVKTQA
jgi:hypothetical protein